jgi:DNA-binding NtrC family response regulator
VNDRPGILIIDRDTIAAQALEQPLHAQGYAVHRAVSCDAANALLQQLAVKPGSATIGVALIDQETAGRGLEAMRKLSGDWPRIVPIVTSAFRKVESAVQAMRLGAADYLLKPIVEAELLDAAQRAMQRHLLMVERELAQQDVASPVESTHADNDNEHAEDDWRPMPLSEAMKAPERQILLAALEANGWNRGRTAEQLDINRTTLYKKIRQHRLDEPA